MSKRYMSRPPYTFGSGVPDFYTGPPMTVEDYKACEAKYFDFLKPEELEIEQPVGAFARLLRFIGMSKSITLDGDGADVQESSSKSQGGGDKEITERVSPRIERQERTEEVNITTVTDMADAEAEIDVNANTTSYRLREEPAVPTTDVHVVSSHDSDKEFNSCRLHLLEEPNENGSIINEDKEKPRKSLRKSLRKFFRRPFRRCLKTEE